MSRPQKKSRFRYWRNLLGFALLALLAAYSLGFPAWLAWGQTRPLLHAVPLPDAGTTGLAGAGQALEAMRVRAADGTLLQGWYLPPRNRAVILLFPGYGGDRRAVLRYAGFLSQAGFGLLMMDPRATGESGGRVRAYGWTDWADGTALVEALRARPEVDPARLGAFGCSTGAEIALGAAALEPRLAAVVADAPYYAGLADVSPPVTGEDWLNMPLYPPFLGALRLFSGARPPMALVDAVAGVAPRRLLLIAGGQSDAGYEARQAAHFYAHAGPGADLWVIPEAGHCGGLRARPQEYPQRVVEFFEAALVREE